MCPGFIKFWHFLAPLPVCDAILSHCPHFDVQKPVTLCTSFSHMTCQLDKTHLLTPPDYYEQYLKLRAYNCTDTRNELWPLKYWPTGLLLMFTILFSCMYIPLSLLVEISIDKQILSINTMKSHLHGVVLKQVK